jgi:uncharacterized damage-inducible protein DinB
MNPTQVSEIVNTLENSRREFIAACEGVTESLEKVAPAPGRWSVLDCVEHVTTVEERFLGWLASGQRMEAPLSDPQKEAELAARVANRTTRVEAPEAVRPVGRFVTLAAALEHFNAARARSARFADDHRDDLYWLAAEHPRLGKLNGVEFLTIIAAHARRHAEQIRETRAAIGQKLA